MIVNIYYYDRYKNNKDKIVKEDIGTIEVDNFDAEEIFNIITSSIIDGKIDKRITMNNYLSLLHSSSGICLKNPEDNSYWFAKAIGWIHGSLEEIEDYIIKRKSTLYM